MKRLALILAAAAIAAPALAQAAETPIEPGYWESTNRVLSPIRTSKVERRCLKPADIEKFLSGPSNRHYDCTYPTREVGGGVIRMAGICVPRKGDGRAVTVSGEGAYTPTSFKITARIGTRLAGIPLSGRASTEARKIADSCPEPETPQTQQEASRYGRGGGEPSSIER